MFERTKLIRTFESLTQDERNALFEQKSASVVSALKKLDLPGVDPLSALSALILSCVVSDGTIDDKEYELMLPFLKKLFGEDYDFDSIKKEVLVSDETSKELASSVKVLIDAFSMLSEELKTDAVTVCLCILSVDGKISKREKRFLSKLV
ncbi:MAG: TerB family tellurite resistance protein [Clostridia bacterium]|nr:TerB family tellurite resistance protein [Clostridia bacterium]